MDDETFWKSTPKQLLIKSRIYSRFRNEANDGPVEEVQFGYIDEIF